MKSTGDKSPTAILAEATAAKFASTMSQPSQKSRQPTGLEDDLRGRRIIAEGLLPRSPHLAVLVFSESRDLSLQALILLLEDIDPLEEFNLAGRFGELPIRWRHDWQLMALPEADG